MATDGTRHLTAMHTVREWLIAIGADGLMKEGGSCYCQYEVGEGRTEDFEPVGTCLNLIDCIAWQWDPNAREPGYEIEVPLVAEG